MSQATRVDELFESLMRAVPEMDADGRRLSIEIYRALAEGRPVGLARLAERTGLSVQSSERILAGWPAVFRDEAGNLIGYWGLAIPEMPHRFEVEGVRLHTWCAWDALFIPEILGQPARYTGRCPVTGGEISLEIGPEGVRGARPDGAALSFLAPERPFGKDVITSFCHHIHFFVSREAAESWVRQRPGHVVLSLEEGLELARRKNRYQYGDLLPLNTGPARPAVG